MIRISKQKVLIIGFELFILHITVRSLVKSEYIISMSFLSSISSFFYGKAFQLPNIFTICCFLVTEIEYASEGVHNNLNTNKGIFYHYYI
jgi:hypothetical protein